MPKKLLKSQLVNEKQGVYSELSKKRGIYSDLSQNGFPKPKKAKCFQCAKDFYIKYVIPQKDYSKKNSWVISI